MKHKILSFLTAFAMVASILVAPFKTASADTTLKPGEKNITVNVHKILMSKDALRDHNSKKEYDPTKKIQDQTTIADFFGDTNAKEIDKVYFVAIKEGEEGYADFDQKTNEEKDAIINKLSDDRKGETTTDGLALKLISPTKDGQSAKYRIYEVKHKSTYVGDNENEKKILAESKAVPVELTLPEHARTENGIADAIHVYPKNTEDGPKVTKKVVKDGQDKDLASFDKDKEFNWAIEADIPTGFKDYKVFELSDDLQQSLTYKRGQTVSVKVKDNNNITLEKGTDYTLTEPTGEKGGKLEVKFTETGIKKLVPAEGKKVRVEFTTTINDSAIMATDIPNKVKLTYGHDPNNKHEKESNEPKVYTGGKKFKKIDSSKNDKALQGATFVVKNKEGKYLVEKEGKYSWKEVTNATNDSLLNDKELKKLVSGSDGKFEIKGLEYDEANRTTGTKYSLVEVKAPDKYALPTNNVTDFYVNNTSYAETATPVPQKLDAENNQLIDNKPITIPETGGIGSIIFVVAGLMIMGLAAYKMKANKEQA